MDFKNTLADEMGYLNRYANTAISIGTTSKHTADFMLLPRRSMKDTAVSNFIINNEAIVEEVIRYFDGHVNTIFIDVERKQEICLYSIAKNIVRQSKLITVKPNDTSLESCDILIRKHFHDDLIGKNVIVIGTGNLASKTMIRIAERQANVYVKGRSKEKENKVVDGINVFLPNYTTPLKTFDHVGGISKADVIISFLAGPFLGEDMLYDYIGKDTLIIDGGINNYSRDFVSRMVENNEIIRLDTRIALPYQFLSTSDYISSFFEDVYGKSKISRVPVVAGGVVGLDGAVIVDNIRQPNQIIGIADGSGGVKRNEQLNEADRKSIRTIQEAITVGN